MRISEICVKRPVATFMFFSAVIVLGFFSLGSIGLELFPNIGLPTLVVFTVYPGVGPYEVESRVTRPVEETISTLNGVDHVSSISTEGLSFVVVSFGWNTDVDSLLPEIREKISAVGDDLPEEAHRPSLVRYNPEELPVFSFNLSTLSEEINIRRLAEKEIRPELEKIAGVGEVSVYGGRELAVLCELDLDSLTKLDISIIQLMQVFQGENINLPGGTLNIDDKHLVLRTIGEFHDIEDISNVLITYRQDVPVYLGDVATVSLAELPQEQFVRTGGREGVRVAVRKQPGHNTIDITDAAKETLEELKNKLPPSVVIEIHEDQSISIMESIGGVTTAAWQGGLIAIVILLLFLRNIPSTLIITLSIPISVIATFSLMKFASVNMNIISLAGITLGIGMFVDSSIVVLESTYRHLLRGKDAAAAAVQGTNEVAAPVIAAGFTTMAVFIPLLFTTGIAKIIFTDLALTISFAIGISLIVALTLIPVLNRYLLRLPKGYTVVDDGRAVEDISLADIRVSSGNRIFDAVSNTIQRGLFALDRIYELALGWAIRRQFLVVGIATLLLVISVGSIFLLGMDFFADTDEGEISINVETRIGSSFDRTWTKVQEIENLIRDLYEDDVEAVSTAVGESGEMLGEVGSHFAVIQARFSHKDTRDTSIWEIIKRLDQAISESVIDISHTINLEGMSALVNFAAGSDKPIVIELFGDDLNGSHEYARRVANVLKTVDGTRDTEISYKTGKPEIQFRINRRQAAGLGLSAVEIATTIRTAFKGSRVSHYRSGEDDYDVILSLQESDKQSRQQLGKLFFINRSGTKVPIENVVDIDEGFGPISIERKNRTRFIEVNAFLTGDRPLNRVMADIQRELDLLGPPPGGIERKIGGSSEQMLESFKTLGMALALAFALVYIVMAAQFESLLHPLIVMFSVPFSAIGLVAAFLLTNTTFTIVGFIGGIVLVGIVVNSAIILIDYINLLRKNGVPLRESIVRGGKTRLKPVLMTTATTVFAMLPMALGFGTGAEMRAPMARAIVGGLTSSTLITLILVPTLYWIIESRLEKRRISADEKNPTPA